MNSEKLMDAIGMIDRQYVAKYENVHKIRNKANFVKWGVAAACLCLLVGALGAAFMRSKPKAPETTPVTTVKPLPYAVVPKTLPPVPEDENIESSITSKSAVICVNEGGVAQSKTGDVLTLVFYLTNYGARTFKTRTYCIDVPSEVELLTPQEFIFDPSISPFFEVSFRLLDDALDFGSFTMHFKSAEEEDYAPNTHKVHIYYEREECFDYSAIVPTKLPNYKGFVQFTGYGAKIRCACDGDVYQYHKSGEDIVRGIRIVDNYRFKKWHITLQTTDGIILKTEKEFVFDYTKSDMFDVVFDLADGYERGTITVKVEPIGKYAGECATMVSRIDVVKKEDAVVSEYLLLYLSYWEAPNKDVDELVSPDFDINKIFTNHIDLANN